MARCSPKNGRIRALWTLGFTNKYGAIIEKRTSNIYELAKAEEADRFRDNGRSRIAAAI